jgi:hypothetical protein
MHKKKMAFITPEFVDMVVHGPRFKLVFPYNLTTPMEEKLKVAERNDCTTVFLNNAANLIHIVQPGNDEDFTFNGRARFKNPKLKQWAPKAQEEWLRPRLRRYLIGF